MHGICSAGVWPEIWKGVAVVLFGIARIERGCWNL